MTDASVPQGLEATTVSCWYGQQQVVWDVSLTIPAGSGVALVGRNGVGKTTFLRGLMHAFGVRTSGRVSFGGTDISSWGAAKIARAGIGFVPHDRRILPLTVLENMQLGARGARGWTTTADLMLDYFPLLKSRLKQRGDTLSGGEQQALAIARALMAHPRFLILDEPAEGLAPQLVARLIEALTTLRQEMSFGLLVVDRNTELITSLCNEVHGMSKGMLVHHATATEFGASEEVRVRMLAPSTQASPGPEVPA